MTQHKKMKFYIKDLFSKSDQIPSLLRIWSHLLKKYLMENFIFCAVKFVRLKQPFENYLMDSFQEGYITLQKYPQA